MFFFKNFAPRIFFLKNLPFEAVYLCTPEPGIRRKAGFQAGMAQKVNTIHIVFRGNLRKQQPLVVALFYNKTMPSDLNMTRDFFWRGIYPFGRGKNSYLNNYIVQLFFSDRRKTRVASCCRDCRIQNCFPKFRIRIWMPYATPQELIFRKRDKNPSFLPNTGESSKPSSSGLGSFFSDRNDSIVFLASLTAFFPSVSVSILGPTPLLWLSRSELLRAKASELLGSCP